MSHSSGTVTFKKDNLVMHCEYDGTSDVMIPQLFDTNEEMVSNWRKGGWKECSCGGMEPVTIHSDYGNGFSWNGEACRTCKAINYKHLDSEWEENQRYREEMNNRWSFGLD